jgi:bifunctional UDP-N-acetylglucosamine pyrophosphorylase/glucosamine-1-phosphate N-acetyltransferase
MVEEANAAAVIFAAGFGSRMKGFFGNKTLLPLVPGSDPFKGSHPIIVEIIGNLPEGPKAIVVHHGRDEVMTATRDFIVYYCEQSVPNGTGGALIAARDFLEQIEQEYLIITMGDAPFVKKTTYQNLISQLKDLGLVVLGFRPIDRAQYGLVEIDGEKVIKITEWRYWREYSSERQRHFKVFNSGIYAARRSSLIEYLPKLEQRPHKVQKERGGRMEVVEEYFITDLVELMNNDGLTIGYIIADEEQEVMGIDTVEDLVLAQAMFAEMNR